MLFYQLNVALLVALVTEVFFGLSAFTMAVQAKLVQVGVAIGHCSVFLNPFGPVYAMKKLIGRGKIKYRNNRQHQKYRDTVFLV